MERGKGTSAARTESARDDHAHFGFSSAQSVRDAELLTAVEHGVVEALAALYDRFAPGVYRLARGLVGDAVVAERVVEDVFLTLWRSSRLDPPLPAATWLVMLTRSCADDALRAGAGGTASSGQTRQSWDGAEPS